MRTYRPVFGPVLAVLLVCFAPIVFAQTAPGSLDARTRDIQGVITRQLEAFAHGDGAAAEELAAPGIRDKFPDAAKFLDMVKTNYAALVRPRSTQFAEVVDTPNGPLQKLTVVAADGTVWSAIYSLQQVDGLWRISGCAITRDETQQAI